MRRLADEQVGCFWYGKRDLISVKRDLADEQVSCFLYGSERLFFFLQVISGFFATLLSCPGQFSAFFSSPPVVFWCSGQLFSHFFFALFLISFCSPPPSISTLFPCPAHLVWVEPFYFIYVYCFCSSPFSAIPCLPPPIPVFSLLQHNTHNTHTYTHTQIQP